MRNSKNSPHDEHAISRELRFFYTNGNVRHVESPNRRSSADLDFPVESGRFDATNVPDGCGPVQRFSHRTDDRNL